MAPPHTSTRVRSDSRSTSRARTLAIALDPSPSSSSTHRAREAGVTLEAAPPEPGFGGAALSPDALRQVLLNLCVNAIEACDEGGTVRVSARRRTSGGGHVEIWVEDDGPGIIEADRELVFEPFHSHRSDTPGGLGLAISRQLAEEAGGRLFVAQATEGGARFVLRLPTAG